jgi:hypothetical protein
MTKLSALLLCLVLIPQNPSGSVQNGDGIIEKHLAALGALSRYF